jgi:hypothetical protein
LMQSRAWLGPEAKGGTAFPDLGIGT